MMKADESRAWKTLLRIPWVEIPKTRYHYTKVGKSKAATVGAINTRIQQYF